MCMKLNFIPRKNNFKSLLKLCPGKLSALDPRKQRRVVILIYSWLWSYFRYPHTDVHCETSRVQNNNAITVFLNLSGGRAMVHAVCCRPLTAEAWVRARFSSFAICGGQSSIVTGFCSSSSVFPCNIIPPWLSILIYLLDVQQVNWWLQFKDSSHPIDMNKLSGAAHPLLKILSYTLIKQNTD
jgi:hypothetical protein